MKGVRGLDFVAVDPGIVTDRKIVRMACALKRPPVPPNVALALMVAGAFPHFLGEVAKQAPDGNLSTISDEELDSWAYGWPGFGTMVRELLCDDTGTLTAWAKYNGKALVNLVENRDRVRAWREDQRAKKAAARAEKERLASADHAGTKDAPNADSTGSVHVRLAHDTVLTDTDTDTDTEDLTREQHTHAARPDDATMARLRTAVLADASAAPFLPDFEASFRAARDPVARAQVYLAMHGGMNAAGGVAVPLAVMGQALQEMRANGSPWSAKTLRVFCRDLMQPSTRKPAPATGDSPGQRAHDMALRAARAAAGGR